MVAMVNPGYVEVIVVNDSASARDCGTCTITVPIWPDSEGAAVVVATTDPE
jgi:hypothetical protein